ncbi:MAG: gliding motility-associated C-terminal domain-containing protein [Muribaculaceae bacterium]|nr:gliding motility-associated C-terminal domain-containing protein [Muribaculaceae bacterium]
MKRRFSLIAIIFFSLLASFAGNISFTGLAHPEIDVTPAATTGLQAVYVLSPGAEPRICYEAASSGTPVIWKRFSNLGAAYAQDIPASDVTVSGRMSSVALGTDDCGYVIEEGSRATYIWVVNYNNHSCTLNSVSVSPSSDCQRTILDINGHADRISFFTINGRQETLSRDIEVNYHTLLFDENTFSYIQKPTSVLLSDLSGTVSVPAPLCNTEFTVTADRFLASWNRPLTARSESYSTIALEATTEAFQDTVKINNQMSEPNATLGGSAPVPVSFRAAVTDAVVFTEWQVSSNPDFEGIDMRYTQTDVDIVFTEQGYSYVRFVADNAAGTCEFASPVYEVFIGESRLECPNAFSPLSSPGVNDIWKVSYKSLISFECHIYNRQGLQMYSFSDPSDGWDGKYCGKLVSPGTYYYVITAEGSDGVQYKKSGDINIIGPSNHSGGGAVTED